MVTINHELRFWNCAACNATNVVGVNLECRACGLQYMASRTQAGHVEMKDVDGDGIPDVEVDTDEKYHKDGGVLAAFYDGWTTMPMSPRRHKDGDKA